MKTVKFKTLTKNFLSLFLVMSINLISQSNFGPTQTDFRRDIIKSGTNPAYSNGLADINTIFLVGKAGTSFWKRAVYQWDISDVEIPDGSNIDLVHLIFSYSKEGHSFEFPADFFNITYDMISEDYIDEIYDQMDNVQYRLETQITGENNQLDYISDNRLAPFNQAIKNSLPNDKFVLGVKWFNDHYPNVDYRVWSVANPTLTLQIAYTPPEKLVTVDQKHSDGSSFGQVGLWNSEIFNFINYPVPYNFTFSVGSTQTLRGDQTIQGNEKYKSWNNETEVINHQSFIIDITTDQITSQFEPTYSSLLIKNNLENTGLGNGTIEFKDPWLIDYLDGLFNNNKRNQGMNAPFKSRKSPFYPDYTTSYSGDVYKGVFLNQGFPNWTPPYYSIKVDAVQDVILQNTGVPTGRNHKFYFQNWSGTNVVFQDINNSETPVVFTLDGATAQANLKGTQLTNTSFNPSKNSQRGFIKDTWLGYLHNVYESMGDIWYERSTDDGTTWYLMNNGKPINPNYKYSDAKSPSICFNSEFNLIYIVYQVDENSFPYAGIVLTQFSASQTANTPNWSAEIWSTGYSYSNNYAPIVASMSSAGVVVIDPPSTDAVGIRAFNYYTSDYPNYSFISKNEFAIPGVNSNSASPSIATGCQRYHLVYEQSQTSIKYYAWGSIAATSSVVSTGSSSIFNLKPVISLLQCGIPLVSWIGGTYNYSGGIAIQSASTRVATDNTGTQWGSINNVTGNIQSISNSSNSVAPQRTLITWAQLSGSNIISKWRKREGTTYTTPASLLPYGIWVQAAADYNFIDPKALVFSGTYQPYYFILSSTIFNPPSSPNNLLSKITEADTIITFGRSGVAVINDIEFAFEIGDILVGDSIINFIEVPDTIVYASADELNEHTRTENFTLTPETQFYFTNIYYVVQKANPDSALTETDAVNFKAELVNAVTGQVVGTFDNITYHKNNILKYNNLDYLVDCSGITPGEYYLRLISVVTGEAEYVMANIVNDNTTLSKKNYNNVSFKGTEIPETYSLEQNYPNPFNPTTTIRYQIPKDGLVTLRIYDILGREVTTLVNEFKNTGKYEVNFNASSLASGVYIYTIKSNDFTASKKLMLLK